MWLRLLMILTCLFISTASFAHGADQHVLGTIMAIDANHVEIKTTKGLSVNVQLNKQTWYKDESNPKGANRPAVGDRVVIKATKSEKKATKCCSPPKSIFLQSSAYRSSRNRFRLNRFSRMTDADASRITGSQCQLFLAAGFARRSFES